MSESRKSYQIDVSDAEWEFLAPYLPLMRENAPGTCSTPSGPWSGPGASGTTCPTTSPRGPPCTSRPGGESGPGCSRTPPTTRGRSSGWSRRREAQPTAAALDRRTPQSTPESGGWAGADGAKKNGSKVHIAVSTPGHRLALKITAASERGWAQVADPVAKAQEATGERWN